MSSLLLLNDNIEKVVQFFDYFLRGQGILILYVDMGMVREKRERKEINSYSIRRDKRAKLAIKKSSFDVSSYCRIITICI